MTTFSVEVFDTICDRIAEGESLRSICAGDDMPSKASFFRWLASDAELSDQYARAREAQADCIVDEILSIADDDKEDPQRSRLRVDARKWMAGKMRPKVYGDKLGLEHSGGVTISVIDNFGHDPE